MGNRDGRLEEALRRIEDQFEDFKRRLVDLARIPSVSADGFPREEVRRSAEAFVDLLRRVGLRNSRPASERRRH